MSVMEQIRTYANRLPETTGIPNIDGGRTVHSIDMHTGGEPLRVIVKGYPDLAGANVLAKRRCALESHDHLRTSLMFEPRGHADMYGCVLVEPNDSIADFGVIFLHNEGYSTMCGHAIIAISKLVFQMGWKKLDDNDNELLIDTPCGRIRSFTENRNGQPGEVKFHCVPSFVCGLDRVFNVPGLGEINYDLAFGGAFYAYVDLRKNRLGFALTRDWYRQIIHAGTEIKIAVAKQDRDIQHPFEPDLAFLYGTIFIDDSPTQGVDSRNVCVFADGEVDRSPTGSGISGRMAIHFARRELTIGQEMKIESIVESIFTGSVIREVPFGSHAAVIPQVSGSAFITGKNTWIFESDDPMDKGFLLR